MPDPLDLPAGLASRPLEMSDARDHAKQVVHHAMQHEAYKINWRCNDPAGTSHKLFSCWSTRNDHRISFYASENGATGGF